MTRPIYLLRASVALLVPLGLGSGCELAVQLDPALADAGISDACPICADVSADAFFDATAPDASDEAADAAGDAADVTLGNDANLTADAPKGG